MSTPGPNWFTDREPWLRIRFGGQLARAALTKVNGLSTKDEWKKQKSKEASGQTKVFSGTTVGDPKLTFLATTADEYAWILEHWEQLKPVPGLGGSSGGTPAAGVPAFALGSPAGKGGTTPAAPSTTTKTVPDPAADKADATKSSSSSTPDPGPRPPTISVEYPWLLLHGITAVARAEWEGPTATETNGVEVTITYSAQDPPKPAGTGTMAPAAPGSQFAIGSPAGPGGAAAPAGGGGATQGNAAAGAAGT